MTRQASPHRRIIYTLLALFLLAFHKQQPPVALARAESPHEKAQAAEAKPQDSEGKESEEVGDEELELVGWWQELPADIPPVLLSASHRQHSKLGVGDTMPSLTFQDASGKQVQLKDQLGKLATVLLFWQDDQQMSRSGLADLGQDLPAEFTKRGIKAVAVGVNVPKNVAKSLADELKINFPILVDRDGKAFAALGSTKLPRIFLLDSSGKILWFDIEYSLSTRRELRQALAAVAAN